MAFVVGVVGAGVMGADVALQCAAAGHRVVLHDCDEVVLSRFVSDLPRSLRGYRLLGAKLGTGKADELLTRIRTSTDLADLGPVDWIVENVTEDLGVKQQVYSALSGYCRPDTRYGVNTSCIPITRIAALLPHPERVIGMHFMNPVPVKRIVEVVQGFHTDQQTILAARGFLASLGKDAIVVQDSPGFVANRLSHLFMNEAAFLVHDGVAAPAEIDAIFRDGYGHKMGPLETADLIGLDTVLRSLEVLYLHYQDPKFRCCPLLRKMVDAGVTGKKAGKGFYEYAE